ncbi:MAG: nicotinate (nicotinamide) nucleotide adenylyltransferase [Clostridia bacterium]|nr:nicotinate (nicotinamide) nucleotide adenylyltransferase [Clostridia bacterium]
MEKIAIFGGSFDPVHTEHVRLAEAAIQGLGLDKLLVMPAFAPPHKRGKELASDRDRIEMCRLAFSHLDKVEISDYEIAQGGTSYTYLTCRHFRGVYPKAQIFWLVGTDMLRDFPSWKNPQDILENVTLGVCARNEKDGWEENEQIEFGKKFGQKFAVIHYNGAPVSSTEIRLLTAAGLPIDALTPRKVAEHIETNGLYQIPYARKALSLEKAERAAHSVRVARLALARARAKDLHLSEKAVLTAALMHDCAKNLPVNSPYLDGFAPPTTWGDIPPQVVHQYQGAYVAERHFGVCDRNVLNAIRYHTSGRPNMCEIEKLIFLADMLEEERHYTGVDELRALFWDKDGLDKCLAEALYQTLLFLESKGGEIYPLTRAAYEFYKDKR